MTQRKMRKIKYQLLPPIGDARIYKEGNLVQFLLDHPTLFFGDLIPPLEVINDLLSKGIHDSGMSGGLVWDKFQIGDDEYMDLKEALINYPGRTFKMIIPPRSIKKEKEWMAWKMEYIFKIPFEEHLRLLKECEKWENLKKEAISRGDEASAEKYHLKDLEASDVLIKFISRFIKKMKTEKGK